MDVNIGEMNSNVQMTDSQAFLKPQILDQIVNAVLARIREEDAHDRRVDDERALRPNVSAKAKENWE